LLWKTIFLPSGDQAGGAGIRVAPVIHAELLEDVEPKFAGTSRVDTALLEAQARFRAVPELYAPSSSACA
jgi:hypothetical protein